MRTLTEQKLRQSRDEAERASRLKIGKNNARETQMLRLVCNDDNCFLYGWLLIIIEFRPLETESAAGGTR